MQRVIQKGKVGEKVKARTAELGKSISAVERESGLSPGMVSRWIAAGSEDYSTLSKLATMADLLEMSLDDLVGRSANVSCSNATEGQIDQLRWETYAGRLEWVPWQSTEDFSADISIPSQNGERPCCGGWWAEREGLKFLLICFCDDMQDENERLDLELYCTPGHNIPLFAVAQSTSTELSGLYTQILLKASFSTIKEIGCNTGDGEREDQKKTIPFYAQSV